MYIHSYKCIFTLGQVIVLDARSAKITGASLSIQTFLAHSYHIYQPPAIYSPSVTILQFC